MALFQTTTEYDDEIQLVERELRELRKYRQDFRVAYLYGGVEAVHCAEHPDDQELAQDEATAAQKIRAAVAQADQRMDDLVLYHQRLLTERRELG